MSDVVNADQVGARSGAVIRKTFCRICTTLCGLLVEIEGDDVRRVTADPDHALTEGYSCKKGRAAGETHHHPDRLLCPTMRNNGVAQRVSWDEALDDLAARLSRIRERYGPNSVGLFLGGGAYQDSAAFTMMRSIYAALDTRSRYSDTTIDAISKFLVTELVAGRWSAPRPDFGRCRMVVYVGTNPMVSHGHSSMLNVPTARLRELTSDGEVWVLDPRRTETADRATRHLAARPGADFAVLAYLVRELLIDGADWAYLEAHAQDVEALRDAVAPFALERAATISGLSEQDLTDFLEAVRRAGRLCVEFGTGVTMSPPANVVGWLCWVLMIVTGSLGREGGAWSNPGFFSNLDRVELPPAPPEGTRGPGPASRPELRSFNGEYPCAAMIDEIEAGNLRALINLSGNLIAGMPDTERTAAALGKLEVIATIDIMGNATTDVSTHVLPAKDQLERVDVSLAVDQSYPKIAGQFTPAMVKARGDVRSYWWILGQLGRRMGLDFCPGVDIDQASDADIVNQIAQRARAPIDTGGEAVYQIAEDRAFDWIVDHADAMGGFRLAPRDFVAQLAELAAPTGLVLISRRQLHQLNSRKLPSDRDIAAIYVNPEDATERGLGDGDLAVVKSAHGRLCGQIKIDPTLIRGALTVPHGWEGQYNVNLLTSGHDVDVLSGMPRFSNLPVELTKA